MNGESSLSLNADDELKRKAENGRPSHGEVNRLMGERQVTSPGPERKKFKVDKNSVIKSPVRSPLNSPKMASKDGSREKPPVKLVIKKEALSPTKNHSKKVSPLSPSKNVSIKQELKSPEKIKPKSSQTESDDDDDIPLAKRFNQKSPKAVKTEAKAQKNTSSGHSSSVKKEKIDKKSPVKKPGVCSDDSDDEPLSNRIAKAKRTTPDNKTPSSLKKMKTKEERKRKKSTSRDSDSEDDYKPLVRIKSPDLQSHLSAKVYFCNNCMCGSCGASSSMLTKLNSSIRQSCLSKDFICFCNNCMCGSHGASSSMLTKLNSSVRQSCLSKDFKLEY